MSQVQLNEKKTSYLNPIDKTRKYVYYVRIGTLRGLYLKGISYRDISNEKRFGVSGEGEQHHRNIRR